MRHYLCKSDNMTELLGKFDAVGLALAKEALEAAEIAFAVRQDSAGSQYSAPMGRVIEAPPMYDVLVDAERLTDARIAVERWQKEAEEAALRESGAPLPSPEELAADAEWERQKQVTEAQRSSPMWLGLTLVTAAVAVLLGWVLLSR